MQAISSPAYNTADTSEDQPMTYYLSPLYSALMSKILEITQRYCYDICHTPFSTTTRDWEGWPGCCLCTIT